jgi:hypothetical protein
MPLGDVNDPEARMKAMSFITQDKPGQEGAMGMDGGTDKSVCAGASIVGAAFLAEGPEGLKAVMKHIESADPGKVNTSAQMNPEYAKLKAKLAKDPQSLTVEDIQLLQQTTYDVLQSRQQKDLKAKGDLKPGDVAPSGISNDTMDAFMKGPGGKDSDLQKMFDKNGMKIAFIDNDGSLDEQDHTAPDHYVVQMSNKDGKQAIYDPNARRGGQIIDFDDGVNLYNQATQDYIGDGKHGK